MNRSATQAAEVATKTISLVTGVLQRKCQCGKHTVAGGQCDQCGKERNTVQREPEDRSNGSFSLSHNAVMQKKLSIGSSNDALEQEADQIADQVLSTTRASVKSVPHIQRHTAHASKGDEAAPASVDRVLAGPGMQLDRSLRQDMEQRFGHDFSRVRVHSGEAAEQSARDVSSNAYSVGHNIVFGAGRFAPGTQEGRRLLAHELTHVVQQSGANLIGPSGETNSSLPITGGLVHTASAISGGRERRVARQSSGATPAPAGPTITTAIEEGLIQELQTARVQAPPSSNIPQEARRTFAVAAVVSPDGKVSYHSAYYDTGTEHAEPQLLLKIQDKINPGDTVAIAIDQVPCSPTSKNCQAALKQFRNDPNHGSLRVYTVRALRKDAPPTVTPPTASKDQVVSPKTAAKRPIQQRFLLEEKEFRRIRLPIYKGPDPGSPSRSGPAAPGPTGPSAPAATSAPGASPRTSVVQPPTSAAQTPSVTPEKEDAPIPKSATRQPTAPPSGGPARPGPKVDTKKALARIKSQGGGGFSSTLKTAGAAAALDFLNSLIKGWTAQIEIEQQTEEKIKALQPAIEAMLATSPKQIHAVISVHIWTAIRDVVTKEGVDEKRGFPMVSVNVELSETAVKPSNSNRTETIFMGSMEYADSIYSVLLIDVEKEQARQEVERKEQELRDRLAALARDEKSKQALAPPPDAPRPTTAPPSLLPPQPETAPPLLPGAPGRSPFDDQEKYAANARGVGNQIIAEAERLRNSGAPTEDRQKFKLKVQVWRGLVQKMIRDFGNYKAIDSLKTTLGQFDERMNSLGSEVGIDGWRQD